MYELSAHYGMSALGRKWTLAVVEIMVIDWQSIRNPYNHDVAQ